MHDPEAQPDPRDAPRSVHPLEDLADPPPVGADCEPGRHRPECGYYQPEDYADWAPGELVEAFGR